MQVDFKFEIDQRVKTILGDEGIVSNLMIDDSGQKNAYVKLQGGKGDWFKENQIESIPV